MGWVDWGGLGWGGVGVVRSAMLRGERGWSRIHVACGYCGVGRGRGRRMEWWGWNTVEVVVLQWVGLQWVGLQYGVGSRSWNGVGLMSTVGVGLRW